VIEWKAFLLRPYPEPRTLEDFKKYTEKWQQVGEQPDAGRFTVWSTDELPPSHSVPPAIAAKAAQRQGDAAFDRYHSALMENYFHANRNITDAQRLVRIAGDIGLDVPAFVQSLGDETITRAVVDDHNQAVSMGIQGVPTVIVDGRWRVTGAQPTEVYRRIMELRLAGESLS